MTRCDDRELSHGATAKARENAVKQDRMQATNAIVSPRKVQISAPDGVYRRDKSCSVRACGHLAPWTVCYDPASDSWCWTATGPLRRNVSSIPSSARTYARAARARRTACPPCDLE